MSKKLKINPKTPEPGIIKEAVKVLRNGGIVVSPFDTVYGLVVVADNEVAVKKAFEIKKRPLNKPFVVFVPEKSHVAALVKNVSKKAEEFMDKFWPGPLAMVFEKSDAVSDIITGGFKTVGIRISDHPVCLAILKELGQPIAVTSVNLSGEPEAKCAEDVKLDVDLILDGGKAEIGVAATVLDVTGEPKVLRMGSLNPLEEKK